MSVQMPFPYLREFEPGAELMTAEAECFLWNSMSIKGLLHLPPIVNVELLQFA
jgi:hypothetical protein